MTDNTIAIAEANAKEAAELDYAKLIKTPLFEVREGTRFYIREATQAELATLDEDERENYELDMEAVRRKARIAEFERKLEKLVDEYEDTFNEVIENGYEVEVVASVLGKDCYYDLHVRSE